MSFKKNPPLCTSGCYINVARPTGHIFVSQKNRCYSIRQKVCEIPGRKRMSSFNQLSEKLTAGVSACAIFKSNREKKKIADLLRLSVLRMYVRRRRDVCTHLQIR